MSLRLLRHEYPHHGVRISSGQWFVKDHPLTVFRSTRAVGNSVWKLSTAQWYDHPQFPHDAVDIDQVQQWAQHHCLTGEYRTRAQLLDALHMAILHADHPW